jgi:Fe-S-cluster containining protein
VPVESDLGRVREQLELASSATAAFAAEQALSCPPGCGACCLSTEVECTVAELGPLAAELVERGTATAVLDQARAAPLGACVLYVPEAQEARRGRCSEYRLRPRICRLFGFAGRSNRAGANELVACRVMRAADPLGVARAVTAVAAGAPVPLYGTHFADRSADEAGAGGRLRPINEALTLALERELLRRHLASSEGAAEVPAVVPLASP